MKRELIFILLMVTISGCIQKRTNITEVSNRSLLFDNTWLFTIDSVTNAEIAGYDDSNWRIVDLPHDWSIEDLPAEQEGLPIQKSGSITGPFDKSSIGSSSTGFTVGGIGWYRKKFVTTAKQACYNIF
jgi:beta-galactosidase